MNPFTKFNHIPWKYIIGMNVSVLALAITMVSLKPTMTTTEQRSQAKETLPPALAQIAVNPQNPPELVGPDIEWAKIGDAVVLKGKNLGTIPFGTLKLGNVIVPHENLIAWEPTQIVLTVPADATTSFFELTFKTTSGQQLTLTAKTPLTITTVNPQ